MKMYKLLTILLLSVVLIPTSAFSHSYSSSNARISNAKVRQLNNRLKLDDKDVEKFKERYSKWDNKLIEANIKADEAQNKLRNALKHNASDASLKSLSAEYIKAVDALETVKRNRNKDIKSILSPRQYAEFVLFDVDFTNELQSSVIKSYKARKEKEDQCKKCRKLAKKESKKEKRS